MTDGRGFRWCHGWTSTGSTRAAFATLTATGINETRIDDHVGWGDGTRCWKVRGTVGNRDGGVIGPNRDLQPSVR